MPPVPQNPVGGTTAKEPVRCAHPGCRNTFIPKTKVNIYCSQICKRRSHEYRFVLNPQRGR